jgi:ribosome recycling factor
MSPNEVVSDTKTKCNQTLAHFQEELKKLRTGRAQPSMLDGIMVQAYGSPMPLLQVASVAAPEAQLIQITPFDPNNLAAISDAIRNDAALGLNPTDDGRVVRVTIPPLTEERRREIVKQLGEKKEAAHVRLRQVRHEALAAFKEAKQNRVISEDDSGRLEKQVDEAMNHVKNQLDEVAKAKEQEIMTL